MLHAKTAVKKDRRMTTPTRKRRGFGQIRRLPSGRWQASHMAPGGRRHNAPRTFDTRKDAEAWLAEAQTDLSRDQWRRPEPPRKTVTFAAYAASWLDTRKLTPRTADEYRKLLGRHLLPAFGALALDEIKPDMIRTWYAGLATGPTRKAHAYGLLHAILATAVADDAIEGANPARIRGATQVRRAREIRPATVPELATIAAGMRPAYQAMVLLAAWCGLRFGELAELRRKDIDLARGVVHVRRGVTHPSTGPVVGTPKSAAGVRDVAIPPRLLPVIEAHLAEHVPPGRDSLLFVSPSGTHLRSDSRMHDEFRAAAAATGRPDLTFHGLRHTGATLAAATGATLAELMARLGHSTPNAAMRYQHATSDRDHEIAAVLSDMMAGGKMVPLRPRRKAGRALRPEVRRPVG
jgi:integrase